MGAEWGGVERCVWEGVCGGGCGGGEWRKGEGEGGWVVVGWGGVVWVCVWREEGEEVVVVVVVRMTNVVVDTRQPMHRIGVRLPASPPPQALDNHQLSAIEG